MSQSRVGENINSFNTNNSFNNDHSFNNTNSFNNTISLNNTISINNLCNVNCSGSAGERAERAEILTWLSPLEPRIRHHDISAHRVEDVGDWLLRTEEYRNWFDSVSGGGPDNSALFCYGDPGVGKTYIR